MRSIDPCPKCGGAKHHKGHSPTGVSRNPNRRIGGEQLPFVMRCGGRNFIYYGFLHKYKSIVSCIITLFPLLIIASYIFFQDSF